MTKYKQNERIPFTDDLMFSMVMRDENICRRLLERILPNEQFGEIRIENAGDDTIKRTWILTFSTRVTNTESCPVLM